MSWYVVYDMASGAIRSSGSSVAASLPAGLATKTYAQPPADGMVWDASTLDYVAGPTPPKKISKLDFLGLLTQAELEAINAATATDGKVAVFMEFFRAANSIDMSSPVMAQSLGYFEMVGLLAAGRSQVILNG